MLSLLVTRAVGSRLPAGAAAARAWSARQLCAKAAEEPAAAPEEPPAADAAAAAEAAAGAAEPGAEPEEGQVGGIEARVAELEAEKQQLHDQVLRAMAEMENVRHIAKRDVDNAKTFAVQKFAKDLLDVSDNLRRATDAVQADDHPEQSLEALMDGVTLTRKQLGKVFNNHGVFEFGEEGEPFDPNLHEALFMAPIPDKEPNTIAQVLQTGFLLHDRVIRAAQVGTVAAPPSSSSSSSE